MFNLKTLKELENSADHVSHKDDYILLTDEMPALWFYELEKWQQSIVVSLGISLNIIVAPVLIFVYVKYLPPASALVSTIFGVTLFIAFTVCNAKLWKVAKWIRYG